MKNILLVVLASLILFGCTNKKNDTILVSESKEQRYFQNPILAGWYPDPSITDDGNGNYYMVHSTFSYYPGIPIFHSKDLFNWKQIGHVLDRPEQLELDGLSVSEGIFAPDISYDNGIFYVTCTMVGGKGNFVVTTKDPGGPWSNPTWLPEVNGIDPALFFDDEKSYIVYNSDAPDNKPLYNGHRTIKMFEFDKDNLKVLGKFRILVNGGVDISKEPIWTEGPRLYKINGYYYLMTAEGGTGIDHSETIYRNTNINDEFVPYEENPILTQRHLDPKRKDPITSTGHADIVQINNGEWYGVFLACRDYGDDHYNTGRETFMAPVKWIDNWPVFDLDGDGVKYKYPLPDDIHMDKEAFPLAGNFTFTDEFDSGNLASHWMFLRTVTTIWYDLHENKGSLTLKTRPETVSGKHNPSFIGHRQQHLKGSLSTSMKFLANNSGEKAGLVAFQNDQHYYFLCKSVENNEPVVQLYKAIENGAELVASQILSNNDGFINLKIEANVDQYNFYYGTDDSWEVLKENMDGKYLSTKVAGGFVGVTSGMYTTSNGKASNNQAIFESFTYTGNDDVYNE